MLSQMEGTVHCPQPAGYALANTAQDAAGLHCCKSALLILVNVLFLHQLRNTLSVASFGLRPVYCLLQFA